jgi:hypothetical protein
MTKKKYNIVLKTTFNLVSSLEKIKFVCVHLVFWRTVYGICKDCGPTLPLDTQY